MGEEKMTFQALVNSIIFQELDKKKKEKKENDSY